MREVKGLGRKVRRWWCDGWWLMRKGRADLSGGIFFEVVVVYVGIIAEFPVFVFSRRLLGVGRGGVVE